MLKITIPETECFDENRNIFISIPKQTLQLEHSLVSVSKWEAKWKKPFLRNEPMTDEEMIDYIRCMTITQNVDPNAYYAINYSISKQIKDYIEDPMTATWFRETPGKPNREIMTSERIYYQMIALQIPFECQKWHFNRLLTLIRICGIENSPKKKMSNKEIYSRNRALNEARKKALGTRG